MGGSSTRMHRDGATASVAKRSVVNNGRHRLPGECAVPSAWEWAIRYLLRFQHSVTKRRPTSEGHDHERNVM